MNGIAVFLFSFEEISSFNFEAIIDNKYLQDYDYNKYQSISA